METLGEEHDIDFLAGVAIFGSLTVWPSDSNMVNATCRLEKKGLVRVRRVKSPGGCCMHVTATIPDDDAATQAAVAAVKVEVMSIEVTVRDRKLWGHDRQP